MYLLVRPLLAALPPEAAHALSLRALALLAMLPDGRHRAPAAVQVMGLDFPGRLGLAAGFDKNGVAVPAYARLGFGFVEVGTVTPRAQPGQPRPRVFRLRGARAVINRMGFPNDGADALAVRLQRKPAGLVVGVNIGKNAITPVERALDDYLACLRAIHAVADYVAVNISSPNTPGLRQLQDGEHLAPLLSGILRERDRLDALHAKRTPVAVKISPDESQPSLASMARVFRQEGVDGVIATNTTLSREAIAATPGRDEAGGLSGAPLHQRSLQVVRELRLQLGPGIALIGVGGVDSPAAALAMRAAGADLVQLYTALVYEGPGIARRISAALQDGAAAGAALR